MYWIVWRGTFLDHQQIFVHSVNQHYTTFTFRGSCTFLVHHVAKLPEIQFVVACVQDIFCNQLNYFIKSCFQLYCTYLQHNAKTGMDKLFIAMCRKLNFASWKRQFCLIRYGNFQGNFFCLGKLKYKKILAKFVLYDFD